MVEKWIILDYVKTSLDFHHTQNHPYTAGRENVPLLTLIKIWYAKYI